MPTAPQLFALLTPPSTRPTAAQAGPAAAQAHADGSFADQVDQALNASTPAFQPAAAQANPAPPSQTACIARQLNQAPTATLPGLQPMPTQPSPAAPLQAEPSIAGQIHQAPPAAIAPGGATSQPQALARPAAPQQPSIQIMPANGVSLPQNTAALERGQQTPAKVAAKHPSDRLGSKPGHADEDSHRNHRNEGVLAAADVAAQLAVQPAVPAQPMPPPAALPGTDAEPLTQAVLAHQAPSRTILNPPVADTDGSDTASSDTPPAAPPPSGTPPQDDAAAQAGQAAFVPALPGQSPAPQPLPKAQQPARFGSPGLGVSDKPANPAAHAVKDVKAAASEGVRHETSDRGVADGSALVEAASASAPAHSAPDAQPVAANLPPVTPTPAASPTNHPAVPPAPLAPQAALSPQAPLPPLAAVQPPHPPPAAQVGSAFVALTGTRQPDGPQRMVIRLDPLELGQVQVRIDRAAGSPARVEIAVERTDTLMTLMQDRPQLEKALDQAGVPAEGRTVTFSLAAPDVASNPGNASGGSAGSAGFAGSGGSGSGGYGGWGGWGGRSQSGQGNASGDDSATPSRPLWLRAGIDITA